MVKGFTFETHAGLHNHGGNAKHGDLAFFPATGPVEKACDDCKFMVHSKGAKQFGRCEKAAEIRKVSLLEIGYVERWTSSCKFYEGRPEGWTPWARFREIMTAIKAAEEQREKDVAEWVAGINAARVENYIASD